MYSNEYKGLLHMANIKFIHIFSIVLLTMGFISNPLLMISMIISEIVTFIFITLSLSDETDNIDDIQSFFNDEELDNKIDGIIVSCLCLFPTLTIITYNILTKSYGY